MWLGGSAGQLVWVPCRPIWSGSLQDSVCGTSGSQDMLHWAPFLFRARPRKISIEGRIQPTASDRLPLSRRNSPSFGIKWKTEPSSHPHNAVLVLRWWFIMKWMPSCGNVLFTWQFVPPINYFHQESGEISLHTSLTHSCLLNWVDFNQQFKVTHQLLVGLMARY